MVKISCDVIKRFNSALNSYAYLYNGYRYYHNCPDRCMGFLIDSLNDLLYEFSYLRSICNADIMMTAAINILLNDILSMIGMVQHDNTFILATELLPIDGEDEEYLSETEIDDRISAFYEAQQLEGSDNSYE